ILGIRVDPLQVLEHEHERLTSRFGSDETVIRLERPLSPGRRIESPERVALLEGAELPEHSRYTFRERRVQRGHRGADLLSNGLNGVRAFEPEVAPDDVQTRAMTGGSRKGLRG